MRTIFRCIDSLEGILSGVYDAWASGLGHENVKLQIPAEETLELFATYREVPIDHIKAEKVLISIRKKISTEAYELVFRAALSHNPEKADRIYRFLIDGFHYGKGIVQMLNMDSVFHIFELDRNVGNETHLFVGFVRFAQASSGILVSKIAPKNYVLPLLAPHFADRLSGENWIIYDQNRSIAIFHQAGKGWALTELSEEQGQMAGYLSEEKDMFQELWKIFFHTITIKERINPICQRNHLPLRYRENMVEFSMES